ncbi:MAG: glycosyltransferase family 4 protein [Candidatus Magnetomorum sp.]|nr:glycosyltransferase family 4 protein [Candidatus Magnetomorum sp.]
MHLLYYHQHFSTPDGATGTRSYEMARRLILRNHKVTMICGSSEMGHTGLDGPYLNGRREGMVDGIHVVEFHLPYSNKDGFVKRSITFLRFAAKSILWALRHPYDLVFSTSTPLTAGLPGIFAKLFRRKPFIFEVRDLWPELPQKMGVIQNRWVLVMLNILEWLSYHTANTCIGLSPGIVQGIHRRGIPSCKIAMIPNGCDVELFGSIKTYQDHADIRTAVFTGAHGIANGLDAVLDAAAVLKKRGRTDIRIVFIGDGKLKPALESRALQEKLDNCLFDQPISKIQLIQRLKNSDVGLMILANVPAFYYGTSPNKFFDYIACGLPVINNYPGWLADLITDHHCGCAVVPDCPEAFADALIALLDHPEQLEIMGKNSRALAESQFERDLLAEQWIQWVEKTYAER